MVFAKAEEPLYETLETEPVSLTFSRQMVFRLKSFLLHTGNTKYTL